MTRSQNARSLPAALAAAFSIAVVVSFIGEASAKTIIQKKKLQEPPPKASPANESPRTDMPLFEATTTPLTVPLILEKLAQTDARMTSLRADFKQWVKSQDTGTTQNIEGSITFQKKDRLRIEHRKPEAQTLVSDGTWFWAWRPANGQVLRSLLQDWKKSQPLAQGLLDFGNYAETLKKYDISIATVSDAQSDGYRRLELHLKPKISQDQPASSDYTLILGMSTKSFFPDDTQLRLNNISARTVFENISFNPDLDEKIFKFTPPPGTDVLDYPGAAPH